MTRANPIAQSVCRRGRTAAAQGWKDASLIPDHGLTQGRPKSYPKPHRLANMSPCPCSSHFRREPMGSRPPAVWVEWALRKWTKMSLRGSGTNVPGDLVPRTRRTRIADRPITINRTRAVQHLRLRSTARPCNRSVPSRRILILSNLCRRWPSWLEPQSGGVFRNAKILFVEHAFARN